MITILFVGLIVILSVVPGLALLLMWTLETVESRLTRVVLTLVLAVSLGAVLEWYQTRVPGRFGTIADAILNAIGAVAGLLAFLVIL